MSTAGAKRHRVGLLQPTETPDGSGGTVRAYALYATVWAEIDPVAAGERLRANQPLAAITSRVRIRWSQWLAAVLDARWQIEWNGVQYDIQGLEEVDTRHREYVLLCVSGLNDG